MSHYVRRRTFLTTGLGAAATFLLWDGPGASAAVPTQARMSSAAALEALLSGNRGLPSGEKPFTANIRPGVKNWLAASILSPSSLAAPI